MVKEHYKIFAIDRLFHYDSMLARLCALLSADWKDLIWNKISD